MQERLSVLCKKTHLALKGMATMAVDISHIQETGKPVSNDLVVMWHTHSEAVLIIPSTVVCVD